MLFLTASLASTLVTTAGNIFGTRRVLTMLLSSGQRMTRELNNSLQRISVDIRDSLSHMRPSDLRASLSQLPSVYDLSDRMLQRVRTSLDSRRSSPARVITDEDFSSMRSSVQMTSRWSHDVRPHATPALAPLHSQAERLAPCSPVRRSADLRAELQPGPSLSEPHAIAVSGSLLFRQAKVAPDMGTVAGTAPAPDRCQPSK